MGFEGYTLVACGQWASYCSDAWYLRTPTPRLATIGRESATTTLGERRARGETTAIGGSFEFEFEFGSKRARARRRCDSNADVAFGRSFGCLSRRF